jgi:Uncharacterized protein conserved in bacteria
MDPLYSKHPRVYLDHPLETGADLAIEHGPLDHYLRHVMRLSVGDHLRLFNGKSGEFLAQVHLLSKKALHLRIGQEIRPFYDDPPVCLAFCVLKKEPQHFY